jgi:hypothetical protein
MRSEHSNPSPTQLFNDGANLPGQWFEIYGEDTMKNPLVCIKCIILIDGRDNIDRAVRRFTLSLDRYAKL